MFSLQQVEDAQERVQAWHGEMRHCISEERAHDQPSGIRRSGLALVANCLRRVVGRRAAHPTATPSNVLAFRRGADR